MWRCLRNRSFLHLKFRRQRPFGRYILDFFCEELNLVVELDGASHLDPDYADLIDAPRTRFLQSRGLTIVRIENDELIHDTRTALDRVERIAKALLEDHTKNRDISILSRAPSPGASRHPLPREREKTVSPSPGGEGGERSEAGEGTRE